MFCPECGHENRETSDFCGECGTPLASARDVLQRAAEADVLNVELDDEPAATEAGGVLHVEVGPSPGDEGVCPNVDPDGSVGIPEQTATAEADTHPPVPARPVSEMGSEAPAGVSHVVAATGDGPTRSSSEPPAATPTPPRPEPVTEPAPPPQFSSTPCPRCGVGNPPTADFCGECGGPLARGGAAAASLPPPRPGEDPPTATPRPTTIPRAPRRPSTQTPPSAGRYASPVATPAAAGVPSTPANTSGTRGRVPAEVSKMGWCWGGFGMHFFWAIANRVWWVPVVVVICVIGTAASVAINILGGVMLVVLGLGGYKMAWRARKFESVEQFRETMRVWDIWGIALAIFNVVVAVIVAMSTS